jgi:hypothetical protein
MSLTEFLRSLIYSPLCYLLQKNEACVAAGRNLGANWYNSLGSSRSYFALLQPNGGKQLHFAFGVVEYPLREEEREVEAGKRSFH